jgi:flagellar M-ring protein FliF
MQQIKHLLLSLSIQQKFSLAIALAVALTAAAFVIHGHLGDDYEPLFTSLSSEDATTVIHRLSESGIDYRLGDGGSTILVPATDVAETRLMMASAGLPKTGRIGFELFDKTNLGVTEFAEHINYQRALEGELERSVMSLSEVDRARVHVTFPTDSVFVRSRKPAKASVLVQLRPGSKIVPSNVTAITHLVASAVEGLDPQSVSVLDMQGSLLSRPRADSAVSELEPSDALLEYQQGIERNLLNKINATLEPVLGPGRFRAGVSVECDFTSGERSEETYDPSQSVMVSSQRSEESTSRGGSKGGGGVPGTQSTLPGAGEPSGSSGEGVSRRTENITYQTARTVEHIQIPQGALKRISASVLVDHEVHWDGEGDNRQRTIEPMPAERLETIRSLVAAAIGIMPERGDQLLVETLPFEVTREWDELQASPLPEPAPTPATGFLQRIKEDRILLGAVAGIVVLLLVVAALLMTRGKRRRIDLDRLQQALPAPAPETPPRSAAELEETGSMQPVAAVASPVLAASPDKQAMLAQVRDFIQQDSELSQAILRDWISAEK